MLLLLAITALFFASLPTAMVLRNLPLFTRRKLSSDELDHAREIPVSILIPARNEEDSIAEALDCLSRSRHTNFEIVVLDDHSEDKTADIIKQRQQSDPRIRLEQSADLPERWNGKQFACWQLANVAKFDFLIFLDADVRITPDALTTLMAEHQQRKVELTSGFPFQETESIAESLLIPMMHFMLLGYLPFWLMRTRGDVGLGAGCGQLFIANRNAYFKSDGHRSIASSRHDGLKLPRSFRASGFRTDCFDASDLARCRMYKNCGEVTNGLLKNADEGIARMPLLPIFTVLLACASLLPLLTLVTTSVFVFNSLEFWVSVIAAVLAVLPRWLIAVNQRQKIIGAVMHPFAVGWFIALQWIAFVRSVLNRRVAWRGRD